jgi:hypothetical protein
MAISHSFICIKIKSYDFKLCPRRKRRFSFQVPSSEREIISLSALQLRCASEAKYSESLSPLRMASIIVRQTIP